MAYVATKFDAQFAHRVLVNLTTLLERDANLALAEVDASLTAFRSYRIPVLITTQFPALFVGLDRVTAQQSDDDAYIRSEISFSIDLALVGSNAFDLQQQLAKYVLALDRVIRTAAATDLVGELSSTNSMPVWEVTEHSFQLLRNDTTLRADASLTVVIQLLER